MRTLLLVDDNEMLRTLAARNLELDVPELCVATIGTCEEARRKVRERTPDALVLDQRLPDGTGVDLMRELAASLGATPVIVVSADTGKALRQRALAAGAFAVLSKPYEAKALGAIVTRALDRSHRPRETTDAPVESDTAIAGEVVARVRHRAINRLAALVAGLRALEADLREATDEGDAVRRVMDSYVGRLLGTATDISRLLRDLRPDTEPGS